MGGENAQMEYREGVGRGDELDDGGWWGVIAAERVVY